MHITLNIIYKPELNAISFLSITS